jgi:hypothetical protein
MIVSEDWSINLVHPLSHYRIQLPGIKAFENWKNLRVLIMFVMFLQKFVLPSSPLTSNYTLMVIHGGTRKLAYFRPGFTTWKTLHHSRAAHFDVIYYEGKFYAVNCVGEIIAYDIKGDDEVAINKVANFSDTVSYFEQLYLVESAKKLLVVSRIRLVIQEEEEEEASAGGSYLFRVFEVVIGTKSNSRIEEVESLGNRALFLGSNSSFSIEASKDFECKPNCIYFTDDFPEYYYSKPDGGGKDMGIYNLEDGSIEKHYKGNSCCFITPPIWVEKSF